MWVYVGMYAINVCIGAATVKIAMDLLNSTQDAEMVRGREKARRIPSMAEWKMPRPSQ
jgi:hypothetical protein